MHINNRNLSQLTECNKLLTIHPHPQRIVFYAFCKGYRGAYMIKNKNKKKNIYIAIIKTEIGILRFHRGMADLLNVQI
jgi:hypothetical protein